MTREEALESGIRKAWELLVCDADRCTPEAAAADMIGKAQFGCGTPDELEGFAVGLQLVAVEVAEIARKRRDAAAEADGAVNGVAVVDHIYAGDV